MVKETSEMLRENIKLDDNLFLDRYAKSVTDNGNIINLSKSNETGYGVWRLTATDFGQILNNNTASER